MLHEHNDERLMMLVAQGHRQAFDCLVQRHLPRACAIASRVGGNINDAEDIAQEAFLKVWVSAPSWKPEKSKFSTWFYRIVVNTSIDRLRRRKPSAPVEWEMIADSRESAETTTIKQQETQRVINAVCNLPEKQRIVIMLCYQKDMTNREAAEIMGIHIKSLEGLLARARKTLKKELNDLSESGS